MSSQSLFDRFWARVIESPSGCWEWQGPFDQHGYGRFNADGGGWQAHRLSYRWWKGPIPSWLQTDHTCRNRACVNPVHLEAVTSQVNNERSVEARGLLNCAPADWSPGRITHCPSGHEYTRANTIIRRWESGKRRCRACQLERVRDWKRRRKAAAA